MLRINFTEDDPIFGLTHTPHDQAEYEILIQAAKLIADAIAELEAEDALLD